MVVSDRKMALKQIDEYIIPPALGNRSGVLQVIALNMESGQ